MPKARRLSVLVTALTGLAVLLSGCVLVKPGTFSLTQPAGIGAAHVRIVACTLTVTEPKPGEIIFECGPPEPGQSQMMLGLMVPAGTVTPETIVTTPGPGAGPATFTRSAQFASRLREGELVPGTIGPPPGFEIAGYVSGVIDESGPEELDWAIDAELGLPPGPGGGSYGGPLKASAILGARTVSAELPFSRPIDCEEEGFQTYCGSLEPEVEGSLGVSDLKIGSPPATRAVPGSKVTVPFILDFASSAAPPPKFALAVTSDLPGAGLGISDAAFSRVPDDPVTNRAPATTRKAMVAVPDTARRGTYDVALTAIAGQGGAVTSVGTLAVRPRGRANVRVRRKLLARTAWTGGIPVKLTAPIAGTRFLLVLRGPRPSGHGRIGLARKVVAAKRAGTIVRRLRIPRPKAEALHEAGAALRLEAKLRQPGTKKVRRLVRVFSLR